MSIYSKMSQADFDTYLDDLVSRMTPAAILSIAGVRALVQEELNNEVLDAWAKENPEHVMVAGCFCGLRGFEIEMTVEQAKSGSHQGACDEDVVELLKVPAIAAQLDTFGPDKIRAALAEYGAWDDEELQDDAQNRARALWSACCDAKENNRELCA